MKRMLAVIMVFCLAITFTSCNNDLDDNNSDVETEDEVKEVIERKPNGKQNKKNEMVYVILDHEGNEQTIIVNEHLINNECADDIIDYTTLDNVKLIKGNQTFEKVNEMLSFKAKTSDIYYTGDTTKKCPLKIKVTYKLDGEVMPYEEIVGKNGNITINFEIDSLESEEVTINNQKETLKVIYLYISTLVFDSNKVNNVTIDNGEVINDGKNTIVLGYSVPGANDNLGLDDEKYTIPSSFTINLDALNFSLDLNLSFATSNIFDQIDMNSINDTKNSLEEKLTSVLNTVNTILQGVGKLASGSQELEEGVKQLSNKILTLATSINKLSENSQSLRDGAKKVYENLLLNVQNELNNKGIKVEDLTIDNYKTVLNKLITNPTDEQKMQIIAIASASLNDKLASVPENYQNAFKVLLYNLMFEEGKTLDEATKRATEILTNANIINTVKASDITKDATTYNYLISNGYDDATATLLSKTCVYLQSIAKNEKAIDNLNQAVAMAKDASLFESAYVDENTTTKINSLCLALGIATLKESITSALESLEEYNKFYLGLIAYTNGVDEMNQAIITGELSDKLEKLVEGATSLSEGTNELNSKLTEFYQEKLLPLLEKYQKEGNLVTERLEKIIEVNQKHQMFTTPNEEMENESTYIFTIK